MNSEILYRAEISGGADVRVDVSDVDEIFIEANSQFIKVVEME